MYCISNKDTDKIIQKYLDKKVSKTSSSKQGTVKIWFVNLPHKTQFSELLQQKLK